MNYGQVMIDFVRKSGRLDLIRHDDSDNGAGFYVNAGNRLLDLLQDNVQTKSWHYQLLGAGTSVIYLQNFRSVEDIWIVDDDGRTEIKEKSLKWIRANYSQQSDNDTVAVASVALANNSPAIAAQPSVASNLVFDIVDAANSITVGSIAIVGVDENGVNQLETIAVLTAGKYKSANLWTSITSITNSTFATLGTATISANYPGFDTSSKPVYYAKIPVKLAPSQDGTNTRDFANVLDWEQLFQTGGVIEGSEAYQGILLAPPTNAVYTLEILARFYGKEMTALTDVTYWTVNWPELSIQAALAELEGFYRNTEGRNDYINLIQQKLIPIDHDLAVFEDEEDESGQMKSSWRI